MHEAADTTTGPGELLQEPRAWSGKSSPEYERVKTKYSSITGALKSNPSATEILRGKFKEQGWLTPTGKPTEEELVTHALGRIELDPNQYGKFIAMLKEVTGLDLIVNILTGSANKQSEGSKESRGEHGKATGPKQSSRATHGHSLQKHDLPVETSKPGAKFRQESQIDSGVVNDVGTPDATDTDMERPSSPPPGSLSRPVFNQFGILPQTAPPLINSGASVNYIPDVGSVGSEGLDVSVGSVMLESDIGRVKVHTEEQGFHKNGVMVVRDSQQEHRYEDQRNVRLEMKHAEAQNMALQKQTQQLNIDKTALQKQLEEKEREIENLKSAQREADRKNGEEIKSLKEEMSKDKKELERYKSRIAQLEQQLTQNNQDMEQKLKEQHDTAQEELRIMQVEHKQEIEKLREELSKQKALEQEQTTKIATLQCELYQKELQTLKEVSAFKDQERALEKERDQLHVKLEILRRKSIEKEKEEEKCKREAAERGHRESQARVAELERQVARHSNGNTLCCNGCHCL